MKKLIVLALAVAFTTGCATPVPPLNFSVPNAGLSQHRLDAEVRSITVTLARPDEQVGRIDFALAEGGGVVATGGGLAVAWQTALIEALNRTLIFRDDGARKVSIAVKVLKLQVPSFGASFTTNAVARYEVVDRANGDIIFTQDVASSGTTPAGHAFLGYTRMRESVNRAVQNNISLFLQAAETIDLDKPMFPAKETTS